jgi:simple sugar transport system ATP-binding protein
MFGKVPKRPPRASHPQGGCVLEVHDLSVQTHRLSLEKVNLQVNAGEVFALAGLEGSGQRIVLQACAGLATPDEGEIRLGGVDITGWSYHRRKKEGVSYVAAGRLEEGLVAGLTLTEHVLLAQPQDQLMIDWSAARKDTAQRIAEYQVVGRPDSSADELSGGNQQRLLFSLLGRPLKLLLLEHPTRGLDLQSADWIWEKFYERCEDGTAILFMSADLDEVIDRSDRIAVFFGGRMSRIVDARDTSVEELGHLIGGEE